MGMSLRSSSPTLPIAAPWARRRKPVVAAGEAAGWPRREWLMAALVAVLAVLAIALIAADACLPDPPYATA